MELGDQTGRRRTPLQADVVLSGFMWVSSRVVWLRPSGTWTTATEGHVGNRQQKKHGNQDRAPHEVKIESQRER